MSKFPKIKCNNVEYRKGYIEVTSNIHDNSINIESWDIRVDIDLSKLDISDQDFSDDGVTGNIEIEMNVEQARGLVNLLQTAVKKLGADNV